MELPENKTFKMGRRRGCDEECLRRIAARLCRLDSDSSSNHAFERKCTAEIEYSDDDAVDRVDQENGCSSGVEVDAQIQNCDPANATNVKETGCCPKQIGNADCCEGIAQSSIQSCYANEGKNVKSYSTVLKKQTKTCNAAQGEGFAQESKATPSYTDKVDPSAEQLFQEDCCEPSSAVTQQFTSTGVTDLSRRRLHVVEDQPEGTSATKKQPSCGDNCCDDNDDATCEDKLFKNTSCGNSCCDGGQMDSSAADHSLKPSCDEGCGDRDGDNSHEETGNKNGCLDECCNGLVVSAPEANISACSEHLVAAFERFESLLLLGKCLCRNVLDQLGFCCCIVTSDGLITPTPICSTHKAVAEKAGKADMSKPGRIEVGDTDRHVICSRDELTTKKAPLPILAPVKSHDIEQTTSREHVVLNVSGMTCTGCSKKIKHVLDRIPGVSDAKVTFLLEIAEFDLSDDVALLDGILSQVEKETGFTCTRVQRGYQHLDILLPGIDALSFESSLPYGVNDFTRTDKKTYRITYDPRIVGARSLLGPGAELAPPGVDFNITEGKHRLHNMLASFGVSLALTVPVVALNWSCNPVSQTTRNIISLVLATLVQGIGIPEFYVPAFKSLIYSRILEMDMLVVMSITCAYTYSCVAFGLTEAGIHLEQEAFFETSALLITLVLLGRLMSAFARVRAVSAVSLRSLQAGTALLTNDDGEVTKVDARVLQFGDVLRISPHSPVVTDGKVTFGESAVDESMVTGESAPARKQAGDLVIAGTFNTSGSLTTQLTRLPGENSITDIANLVEQAIGAKPGVQDLADRIASYFVPGVIGVAVLVFTIWIVVAFEVKQQNGGGAVGIAITYAIAVLAISCPCALGLAVPMVLVIAGGVAARSGVIVKAANTVERGFNITDAVFDKTGTLTKGDLQVVYEDYRPTLMAEGDVLATAKAIVESNDHPVSVAVFKYLCARQSRICSLERIQSVPGTGIQAIRNGSIVKAGSPYWLGLEHRNDVAQLLQNGLTYFCLTIDGELLLVFGLQSTLREEAQAVITELQNRKITCHIVSGDAPRVVENVAYALGIDSENTVSRRSPAQKQSYVQDLQADGRKVLFCGDGTNDAVAIAQADVGVQIGSASDVTGAVADVILLGGLDGVVNLLTVSTRAFRRIRFNFVWTAVYNIFAILLAAGVFIKFRIPPAYAGLGEIVSIVPVILAAASLAFSRKSLVGR
ncbi:heavy metal translocatin [Polychaeton citri CBS 116435]|uniref:Heavy metal translocatin n=1 Tax=Polychaeton citri CBS 116435 TaxID=1314669 RepID=A0A9P4Q2B8_9PEZI|nr:heavy metal translocatin [Polychaeton citri CBS 116435]